MKQLRNSIDLILERLLWIDTAYAEQLRRYAQLWRISNDFWDRWEDIKQQFGLCRKWSSYIGPSSWPDADMLPLGRIGVRAERGEDRQTNLSKDEQITLMTLSSIFSIAFDVWWRPAQL